MYIDVVRDVHIGMTKQPGKNLHVDSFVIGSIVDVAKFSVNQFSLTKYKEKADYK